MMTIKLGQRLFASVRNLLPGDLIEFGYSNKVRVGVVVSPDWKGNVDCYVFERPEDMPEELAEHILYTSSVLEDGDLYVDFGSEFEFKSFKRSSMSAIQQIQYTLDDDQKTEPLLDQKETEETKPNKVTKVIDKENLYGE